jgi:SAM-dependent methyltransferase
MTNRPYYARYDDHYRSLYALGIRRWSDGPDEGRANVERLLALVRETLPSPEGASVLEIGCGEGNLAGVLVGLGVRYTGLDFSSHAIERARERMPEAAGEAAFYVADILDPPDVVAGRTYDLILDQACLHMFVVDEDRRRYLAVVRGLLKPGGVFILTNQARDEHAYEGEIASIEEFEDRFSVDLSKHKEWEAWNGTQWVKVDLPAFACRPRSREAYVEEFRLAGFGVEKVRESGSQKQTLDFVLDAVHGSANANG